VDPELWYDLLNALTRKPAGTFSSRQNHTDTFILLEAFARNQPADLFLLEILSQVSEHFHRERQQFGLYGLYPKYRAYVRPLASYFTLLSLQIIHGECAGEGTLSPDGLMSVWQRLLALYEPWLLALKPGARAATAAWIQQLADESTSLLPWIPGDCGLARLMLDSFLASIQAVIPLEQQQGGDRRGNAQSPPRTLC